MSDWNLQVIVVEFIVELWNIDLVEKSKGPYNKKLYTPFFWAHLTPCRVILLRGTQNINVF